MLSKCVDACGFARSNITTNDRNSKSVAWHSDHWVVLNGQVRTHMWVVVVAVAVLILVSRGCAKCSDNVILVHMSQCTQKMGHMLTANSANSKDNYTYLNSCCPTVINIALIVLNYNCYFISRPSSSFLDLTLNRSNRILFHYFHYFWSPWLQWECSLS